MCSSDLVDEGGVASPRVSEAESTKVESTKAAERRVPAIPLGRVAVDLMEQACSAAPSSWSRGRAATDARSKKRQGVGADEI